MNNSSGEAIGLKKTSNFLVTSKKKHLFQLAKVILNTISKSPWFAGFIITIIIANSISISFETSESWKVQYSHTFKFLDYIFLSAYASEFLLKIYINPRAYWSSVYNIFDFSITVLSFVQVCFGWIQVELNAFKVLRLLRAFCTLRAISFSEDLKVLVSALIVTIYKYVIHVIILIALLMTFFAVVGFYIFGYEETGDLKRWGNISVSLLTLFTFVTADGWTDIVKHIDTKYPGCKWFAVVFIFIGHFIFTNLLVGIMIMNVHDITQSFLQRLKSVKEAQLKLKKEHLNRRQHNDVKKMLKKQKASQCSNFEEMTKGFYETLRNDDYVIINDVSAQLMWMKLYLESLEHSDVYMHRVQQTHRKLALILSEMYERQCVKQYGDSTES